MNERFPDHDQTPLFSRRERWYLYRLPMFGVFVGGFIGIVAALLLSNGREAEVALFLAVVGVLGLISGTLAALGAAMVRALSRSTHRSIHGCLFWGTLIGSYIGGNLGYAFASSGPLDANMGSCGTLIGAIIGVWLGVTVDLFGSCQSELGRKLRIDRPQLFKVMLLIGLTVAAVRVLLSWRLR